MVTLAFPAYLTNDFVALIPKQRAVIIRLLTRGKLASFSLNERRTQGWMIVNAKTAEDVEKIVRSFPLYDYFDFEIDELILHDTAFLGLPKVVMN